MKQLLFATLLCAIGHCAFGADTDGDGLLDLIDVPGFDANAAGELGYNFRDIQDLDGAKLLTEATRLDLGSNRITSIENGDFHGLNGLQQLYLNSNPIASIENGDFQGLNNLQSLGLGGITSIESGDFEGLSNLQSLGLGDITSIENGDFLGLNKLQTLILYENQITSLEKGAFQGLDNLRTLKMGANPITTLENGVFEGLHNLETLDLSADFSFVGGQITTFENGAFQGLNNLQTLDLRGNPLTKLNLTDATFRSLSTLFSGVALGLPPFTELILDDARLSLGSFQTIVRNRDLSYVSLVGLTFLDGNPASLSVLLDIRTLENIRVDQALFNQYAAEFNAFDAIPGNNVIVVSEPAGLFLFTAASVLAWTFHRGRCLNTIALTRG